MPPKLRKPTWCFNLAGAPGVCPKVALLFPPTLSPACSPSCPAGVQHLWPAVPCQLYPHCMWFCPRLRTFPKCPLEGESEIFRGPGEGMSVAWLQAWEADTQRRKHTHRSWWDSCWLCPLIHSYFASWFVPSHQWVLVAFSQAPSGPSSPWTAALKGTDQTVAIATACPGAHAGHGHGRLVSLWVPSGPLMTPAVYPGCGFFLPAILF